VAWRLGGTGFGNQLEEANGFTGYNGKFAKIASDAIV
jgi:hypothetical protein